MIYQALDYNFDEICEMVEMSSLFSLPLVSDSPSAVQSSIVVTNKYILDIECMVNSNYNKQPRYL